jgi:uracil-DNA glycosylase family 4
VSDPSARAEALLYLRWARGAAGRFSPAGDSPAAVEPVRRVSPTRVAVAGAHVLSGEPPAGAAVPEASPAAPPDASPAARLEALAKEASACRRCRLCEGRRSVVFGEGSPTPRLMVVGEAPGADEDATGRPFVGKAGQLLTRMLASIGLRREDVYIANVLKCRPPENRPPQPDEVAACRPYLREQAAILRPELVLVLGNHASRGLLETDRSISSIRGRTTTSPDGLKVLPSFHPAYLLRNPAAKREAWIDLQAVAKELGLPIPDRRAAGESPDGDPAGEPVAEASSGD